jgi:O-antigen/teichoic acid export membrane protein
VSAHGSLLGRDASERTSQHAKVRVSALHRHAFHVILTFGGQGAERALTFVAVALILRVLPVAQSGAFVLMLKVAGFTGVLATLGLQAGAVRLISGALGDGDEQRANALLKAFLVTRLTMVIPLILVGFLAGPWIAAHIFGHKSIGIYVTWGFVSAAANAILMFSLHHLQARQSFVKYTALTVLTTASKLAAVALLIIASALSAYKAAAIWALLPACGAVVGIFLAPKAFVRNTNREQFSRARRELAQIGRWLTLSSMVGIIFVNLDSLLVTRFLGLKAVAWYGAAINLSLMIVILATSLFTVLLPAVSRLTDIRQVRAFFRRSLLLTSAASILLLPVIAVAPWLVRVVYGARFLPAVPAFRFLFAGALLTVIYSTAGVIFLAMNKPIHVAGQAVAQVLASVPFYIALIPRIGIVGGAIGTFAGQLAGVAYVLVFGTVVLRDKGKSLSAAAETEYVT